MLTITGGEPLIRDDLGHIIAYAKEKGLIVTVNSNGKLVPEKIQNLKKVDVLCLSLDGSSEVNDAIRGNGSFANVLNALETCRENNIPTSLGCVLSRHNLDQIDFLLELAQKYGIKVSFQPASEYILGTSEINPTAPKEKEYKLCLLKLIRLKKQGFPIHNSEAGLKHLLNYPDDKRINCSAGSLAFRLLPDSTLTACDRQLEPAPEKRLLKESIKEALLKMTSTGCNQCWCASTVEFNLISPFNLNAIFNLLRTFNSKR